MLLPFITRACSLGRPQSSKSGRSERSRERSRRPTDKEGSRGSKRSRSRSAGRERDRSRGRRRREEGVPHEDRWQPAGDAPQPAPEAAADKPAAAAARDASEQQPRSDSKSGDTRCAARWVTGPGALPSTCHYLFPVDPHYYQAQSIKALASQPWVLGLTLVQQACAAADHHQGCGWVVDTRLVDVKCTHFVWHANAADCYAMGQLHCRVALHCLHR